MQSTSFQMGKPISTAEDLQQFFEARTGENSKAMLVVKKDGTLTSVENLSLGGKIMCFFRGESTSLRGLVTAAGRIDKLKFLKENANFAFLVERHNCGALWKIKLGTDTLYKNDKDFRKKFDEILDTVFPKTEEVSKKRDVRLERLKTLVSSWRANITEHIKRTSSSSVKLSEKASLSRIDTSKVSQVVESKLSEAEDDLEIDIINHELPLGSVQLADDAKETIEGKPEHPVDDVVSGDEGRSKEMRDTAEALMGLADSEPLPEAPVEKSGESEVDAPGPPPPPPPPSEAQSKGPIDWKSKREEISPSAEPMSAKAPKPPVGGAPRPTADALKEAVEKRKAAAKEKEAQLQAAKNDAAEAKELIENLSKSKAPREEINEAKKDYKEKLTLVTSLMKASGKANKPVSPKEEASPLGGAMRQSVALKKAQQQAEEDKAAQVEGADDKDWAEEEEIGVKELEALKAAPPPPKALVGDKISADEKAKRNNIDMRALRPKRVLTPEEAATKAAEDKRQALEAEEKKEKKLAALRRANASEEDESE